MNNITSTDAWITHLVIVLGLTVAVGAITLTIPGQLVPKLLIVLGVFALIGLIQLLIPSPLDQ